MADRRLMLLDTASLYFRAFYGLPSTLTDVEGRPVNAVRGLLDFIARFVGEYRPTHLACCWDNDWRPQWRVDLLPSYKTHRVSETAPDVVGAGGRGAESGVAEESPDELTPQVPVIRAVLAALGIAVVGRDGYEADDVIGTLASTAGTPVDVVTGDRDLLQLVDDRAGIRVLYVARGISRHERVDEAWVQEKYDVPPSAYADFAALRGDASDGIPGVPGVGAKTAAQLIHRHGSLDGIVAAASRADGGVAPGVRSRLGAAVDYLAVAPEVIGVVRDLELGVTLEDLELPTAPADPEGFAALVERSALGGSARRITTALADRG